MGKIPGFFFYSGDWLKDPELRRCTKTEKGVWIDMLAVLSECADRGVFSTGGVPWSDREIAEAIGGDIAETLTCLRELLRKGVARRNGSGAVFSARMVKDESGRMADNARKKNQRVREKCPEVVTPNVHRSAVREEEVEKPLVVGFELPKPDYKPVFTLEDFDPQVRFQALCEVYPKPNRSYLGVQAYQRAIEGCVSGERPDRNNIADAIEQAATAYRQAKRSTEKKFIPELIAWLDKGIWSQDPAVWEDSGNGDGQRKQTASSRFTAALRGANAAHGKQLEKP